MKHIIILFFLGLSFGTLSAQQPDESAKRALEREVKTSEEYVYGEAVANTKDEAVRMAKADLVSEINIESSNHPEWQITQPIQTKDVENNIDIIDLMRGNKFRIVAYIKKDNLSVNFHSDKTPKVELSDKTVNPKESKQSQSAVTQVTSTPSAPTVQATIPKETQSKAVVATPTTQSINVGNSTTTNTGDLLEQIKAANSINEIQKIIDANKRKGKIVSGTMDKLRAPENAYLVVYKKTGEVIAILDKGSVNNRKDLLSGEIKGNEILRQNQVIWFQLF